MTTYEPADWRPEPGDLCLLNGTIEATWCKPTLDQGFWRTLDGSRAPRVDMVKHARRLQLVDPASVVVLDPNDADDVQRFRVAVRTFRREGSTEVALRSLLPVVTPPEPNGLGAVVEDDEGDVLLRDHYGRWLAREQVEEPGFDWDDLTVTRIVSHGVGCSCGAPDCNGGDQ